MMQYPQTELCSFNILDLLSQIECPLAEAVQFKPQEHDGQGGSHEGHESSPVENASDHVDRKSYCHTLPALLQTRESFLVESNPTWCQAFLPLFGISVTLLCFLAKCKSKPDICLWKFFNSEDMITSGVPGKRNCPLRKPAASSCWNIHGCKLWHEGLITTL